MEEFMRRNKKRIIIGSVVLTLILGVCYLNRASGTKGLNSRTGGTDAGGNAAGAASVQAVLFEVTKGRLPDAIDGLIGTVKGNTIELSFNGQEERLAAIYAQVGEKVRKGDVLF